MSELMNIADKSKIQKIEEMLKSGLLDINKIEDNGFLGGATYLDKQLKTGSKDVCDFLIKNGAKTSLEIKKIFELVFIQDVNEVKKVIKSKVDANLTDEEGRSIFGVACGGGFGGNIEIVKHLLENGADINIGHKESNYTPLMGASRFGKFKVVKFLLENGADATIKSKSGVTALDLISERFDIPEERKNEIISLLLKYGAKI